MRRLLAFFFAIVLVTAVAPAVLADAANPLTINVSSSQSDPLQVTLSGTWTWNRGDCDDRWVGWAVDWGDPAAPGHVVPSDDGPDYHVGTPTDNEVHLTSSTKAQPDCGTGNKPRTGTWGPISHRYASPGAYQVCALMYDVHHNNGVVKNPTGNHGLVAGGGDRNRDNSSETNDFNKGEVNCAGTTIIINTPTPSLPPPPSPTTPPPTPTTPPPTPTTPPPTPTTPPPTEPPAHPGIDIQKSASPKQLPAGGGQVTYTYTVRNTGDVPLVNVTVNDDKCAPVDFVSGDDDSDLRLDVAETWTYRCIQTLTVTTTNVAVATGHYKSTTVTDQDNETVTVTAPGPGIDIVKSASPKQLPAGGGEVTYTYTVSNTGNIELSNITVTDDKCAPVEFVAGDADGDALLDLDETWTYQCSQTITETTENVGVATGRSGGTTVRDTDNEIVTVIEPTPNPATPTPRPPDPTPVITPPPTDGEDGFGSSSNGMLPILLLILGAGTLGLFMATPIRSRVRR